jgi:hypothetical protein
MNSAYPIISKWRVTYTTSRAHTLHYFSSRESTDSIVFLKSYSSNQFSIIEEGKLFQIFSTFPHVLWDFKWYLWVHSPIIWAFSLPMYVWEWCVKNNKKVICTLKKRIRRCWLKSQYFICAPLGVFDGCCLSRPQWMDRWESRRCAAWIA